MLICHHTGAFQQVTGAGVIAKSGPFAHDLGILLRRQRCDRRPTGCEPVEIVLHGGDGRLLQHDF